METLVTPQQMKACDEYTIQTIGIPSMVLMERAALAVFQEVISGSYQLAKIAVVCGTGNNGGDGFAIARLLHLAGYDVTLHFVGSQESLTAEAKQQKKSCAHFRIPESSELNFSDYSLVIDAVLGIGLSGNVRSSLRHVLSQMNQSAVPILAVDIPSGLNGATGLGGTAAIRASSTVTFQFKKIGMLVQDGPACCGHLIVADVGISSEPLH